MVKMMNRLRCSGGFEVSGFFMNILFLITGIMCYNKYNH